MRMEHNPLMNVHFPPSREAELHAEMMRCSIAPWTPQPFTPFGKEVQEGNYYFHLDVVGNDPSCTVCILRKKPGHWLVHAIIPDDGQPSPLTVYQYKRILSQFHVEVVEPAVNLVKGVAAIEMSISRLEDHFSPTAVELLQRFCSTSNQSDLGSHLSDQEKWIAFLVRVYDDSNDVHCDIFGDCLRNANWWPEAGISRLIREYDFALRLLKQSGR